MRETRSFLLSVRFLQVGMLLLAGLSSGARAADPPRLFVGDTVEATLPPGDPAETWVEFDFLADEPGKVQIDVRSLDLDVILVVSRAGPDGTLTEVGRDDDSGLGNDSRLILEAESATWYRFRVGRTRLECRLPPRPRYAISNHPSKHASACRRHRKQYGEIRLGP